MDPNKKKYYVNMGTREISQIKYGGNNVFMIYATDEEVNNLRGKLNEMQGADGDAYIRVHIPFIPYHNDKSNDDYDKEMADAFQMIYDLGDEQTKAHIEEMGVLRYS